MLKNAKNVNEVFLGTCFIILLFATDFRGAGSGGGVPAPVVLQTDQWRQNELHITQWTARRLRRDVWSQQGV